jgi:hypothetical protein
VTDLKVAFEGAMRHRHKTSATLVTDPAIAEFKATQDTTRNNCYQRLVS